MKCECCDSELAFRWTDTHGVAVCGNCGMPYRIIHYDENKNRIEKDPVCQIKDTWKPLFKKYWEETGRMVAPAGFDMGFLSGRKYSYSGATEDDVEKWNEWCIKHSPERAEK